MIFDLDTVARQLKELDRRLWQVERNCAGCPGSTVPQDFDKDTFPLDPCPRRRRSDFDSPGEPK